MESNLKQKKVLSGLLAMLLVALVVAAALVGSGSQSISEANDRAIIPKTEIYYKNPKYKLVKGRKINTITYGRRRRFRLRFEIRIKGYRDTWGSIFHVGNTNGIRVPALWQYPGNSKRLHIRIDRKLSGGVKRNQGCDPDEGLTLPFSVPIVVEVRMLSGSMFVRYNGQYTCRMRYFWVYQQPGPQAVYFSNPWHPPARANVWDLYPFDCNTDQS